MTAEDLKKELSLLEDKEIAEHSGRFFKSGPGQYGEGDIFRGIRVPVLRKLARKYRHIPLPEVEKLLASDYHEDRLLALFLLIWHFTEADDLVKEKIYHMYIKNIRFINNWDLVDSSAEYIIGAFLWDKEKKPLYLLAESEILWDRRISIMATFHFIKKDSFGVTLDLAEKLLNDKEDLIHKAVGWMLREVGNRDHQEEEKFLQKYHKQMPRTMLRYAIEKFPKEKRLFYLQK